MAIHDDVPKGTRFAKVTIDVILDQRLSPIDVRVLAYLLTKTANWTVHTAEVARTLKVSDRTVRRCIERLCEAGYAWRRITKTAGLRHYPDVVIYAYPQPNLLGAKPDTGEGAPVSPDTLGPGAGQNRPELGPDMSTTADTDDQISTDSDDRVTQPDSFTQRDTTHPENTQANSLQGNSTLTTCSMNHFGPDDTNKTPDFSKLTLAVMLAAGRVR